MTPERWSRIKEIFGAALETPPAERGVYLDSACGGDAELRGGCVYRKGNLPP
jgi:hypothetical protein